MGTINGGMSPEDRALELGHVLYAAKRAKAERLPGWSPSARSTVIERLIRGYTREPGFFTIVALARALDLDLNWLALKVTDPDTCRRVFGADPIQRFTGDTGSNPASRRSGEIGPERYEDFDAYGFADAADVPAAGPELDD